MIRVKLRCKLGTHLDENNTTVYSNPGDVLEVDPELAQQLCERNHAVETTEPLTIGAGEPPKKKRTPRKKPAAKPEPEGAMVSEAKEDDG